VEVIFWVSDSLKDGDEEVDGGEERRWGHTEGRLGEWDGERKRQWLKREDGEDDEHCVGLVVDGKFWIFANA
jgi:hypothetical protein